MHRLFFRSLNSVVDKSELHRQAYNIAFAELNLDWHWSAEHYTTLQLIAGERHRVVWFAEHTLGLRIGCGLADKIYWYKRRIFDSLLKRNCIEARPGVIRLLEEAEQLGVSAELQIADEQEKRILDSVAHEIEPLARLARNTRSNLHIPFKRGLSWLGEHQTSRGDSTIAIDQYLITDETARNAGVNQRIVHRCFNIERYQSARHTCITHLGDPDNPAVHISGENVLRQGVASLSSLAELSDLEVPA